VLTVIEPAAEAGLELREAKAHVRRLMEHHVGGRPRRIEHKASGLSNFVFLVAHPAGSFVVRICPVPGKINSYIKEQWASARAREAGVPTPEILEVGNEVIPHPYMISLKVAGEEATHHPQRLAILREMGRLAERINSIRTDGFGAVFDWSSNQLSHNESWHEFLEREFGLEERLEVLARHGLMSDERLRTLRAIVGEADPGQRPALNHGDLRPKNVMVGPNGRISAIIDWENCVSGLAPQWELSVALHDLSIDEKQEFLEGYGLAPERFAGMAPLVKAINVLNYAPHIEALVQPDDARELERYRVRLSGALDLYSP
jgi:hygromycin-B 4-O-kinase